MLLCRPTHMPRDFSLSFSKHSRRKGTGNLWLSRFYWAATPISSSQQSKFKGDGNCSPASICKSIGSPEVRVIHSFSWHAAIPQNKSCPKWLTTKKTGIHFKQPQKQFIIYTANEQHSNNFVIT